MSVLFENGGRKLWLVLVVIIIAVLNDIVGLGVSHDTMVACLIAAVGGSGTIALEDGLRAAFGIKTKKEDPPDENA